MAITAIDLFDLWISLRGNVNTQQGGFIRPQGNFQRWINEISFELFREKIAQFQVTQMITDELAPFLKTVNVVLTPQPGKNYDLAVFPVDYAYYASSRILVDANSHCGCMIEGAEVMGKDGKCKPYQDHEYKEIAEKNAGADLCELSISLIPNQMWGAACNNSFKKPSYDAPIITQFASGFKVAPRNLGVIVLDYFKLPREAVFGYTLSTDDNIIYNASTSTQLEWPDSVKGEFLARLQKRYGMFVREEFIYQASEQERQINK